MTACCIRRRRRPRRSRISISKPIALIRKPSDRDAAKLMDEIADTMAEHGVDVTLRERKLALSRESQYADDDFKFNPYGIVRIEA
jgi:hypothetical protein